MSTQNKTLEERTAVRRGFCRSLKEGRGVRIGREEGTIEITVIQCHYSGLSLKSVVLDVQGGETPGHYFLSSDSAYARIASDVDICLLCSRPRGERSDFSFFVKKTDVFAFY